MKTAISTPSSAPTKKIKKDPFQRLSLAVKQLDQLIDRAHQLSSLTDQLMRKDTTGPRLLSSTTDRAQPSLSGSSQKCKTPPLFSKKQEKS